MENTKRDLSLDFTKPRHPRGGQPAPSLVTPILNLSTPELSKLISEQDELAVLTPNGISSIIPQSNVLPSPLIPTTVNSNNIINNSTSNNINDNNNHINNNNNNNSCHINRNNGVNQNKRQDKQRDVDIEKIEKKRERNRLAAKKCRQRKLETIDELRKTVSDWEQKYHRLELEFERFKNIRNKDLELLTAENSELKSLINRR